MGKIKLYELAKEMDVSSKELLEQAKLLGMDIKSHLSSLEDKDVEILKEKYSKRKKENAKKENKKPRKDTAQKNDNPRRK